MSILLQDIKYTLSNIRLSFSRFYVFILFFSPSSLTGKKSNEIILGGLNSLKSAATTVVKKFDEIKEAISATSTPVKNKEREQKIAYGVSHESLDSLTDGSIQDRNETRASGREYKIR